MRLSHIFKSLLIILVLSISTSVLYGQQAAVKSGQKSFRLFEFTHRRTVSSDNVKFRDWEVFGAVPAIVKKNFAFLVLPTFRYTSVANVNFQLPNSDFYEAFLPFILQKPISSSKNAGVIIIPGIASNFQGKLESKDFNLFGAVYLGNSQAARFQYRYGIFYLRSVNGNLILPAFTFDWRPTNRLRINANNPLNPDITYQISPRLRIGLEYARKTREYNLNNGTYLKDIQSAIEPHIDVNIFRNIVLTARGGYAFERNLETYKDVDIGSSWFEGFKSKKPLNKEHTKGWFIRLGLSLEVNPGR